MQAAHGADVLVHEATFAEAEKERARETLHATAVEAAEVAKLAQVKLLALTHVSTRYFGAELARQAREVFPETVVPRDFDVVDLPFPERGTPQLLKGAGRPPRKVPYDPAAMSRMVQVATAGDVTEAEELQELLRTAGIDAELEAADGEDGLMVMVPDTTLEAAQDAIEALSEPDDLIAEP